MKTSLTKGLDKDAAKEVEMSFKSSAILRERYIELLNQKSNAAFKESISKGGYNCPNWSYLQADYAGYCRALEEISSLLK